MLCNLQILKQTPGGYHNSLGKPEPLWRGFSSRLIILTISATTFIILDICLAQLIIYLNDDFSLLDLHQIMYFASKMTMFGIMATKI